jgi:hypothetical protein
MILSFFDKEFNKYLGVVVVVRGVVIIGREVVVVGRGVVSTSLVLHLQSQSAIPLAVAKENAEL